MKNRNDQSPLLLQDLMILQAAACGEVAQLTQMSMDATERAEAMSLLKPIRFREKQDST